MEKLKKSFRYAFQGVSHSLKTQRNLWIHFFIASLTIPLGVLMGLSSVELAIVALTIVVVISLELVNTVAEVIVNLISPEYHRLAEIAKDVAAGTVLIGAIGSIIVGLFIFLPHFIKWAQKLMNYV